MTIYCLRTAYTIGCDRCISYIYVHPAKGVVSVMAARVQIPASPLKTPGNSTFLGFCYAVVYSLQIVIKSEKLPSTVYTTAYIVVAFYCLHWGNIIHISHYSPVRGVYF